MKKFLSVLIFILCFLFTVSCATHQEKEDVPSDKESGDVPDIPSKTSVKILAIGNSFTENAMLHLYSILQGLGVEEIILGYMFIGGSSIHVHYENALNDSANYAYRKADSRNELNSGFVERKQAKLSEVFDDENWQVITFQQTSGLSGFVHNYNDEQINYLIDYALARATNPSVKIGWQMSWAYQSDSNHPDFIKYNFDQTKMYTMIKSCVQEKIVTNQNIDFVIPSATAIQNARTSYFGDKLTADGYHLNSIGCYIVGLTWALKITGLNIDDFKEGRIPLAIRNDFAMCSEAALNAINNPFEVSTSTMASRP